MRKQKVTNNLEGKGNESTTGLRVETDIKETLNKEIKGLKKKKIGSGRINQSLILRKALMKLDDEDRAEILASTVTAEDRLIKAFSTYEKQHTGISQDEFLDLLQYGEIAINDYLPENMKRLKRSSKVTLKSAL